MEWRAIPGYEGLYEVSDTGLVRSLPRVVTRRNGRPQPVRVRILRYHTDGKGYHDVHLSRDGKQMKWHVSHLVLMAFVGPRPPGLYGLHKDDDPGNNTPSNLYWGTDSDNKRDAWRHGRWAGRRSRWD